MNVPFSVNAEQKLEGYKLRKAAAEKSHSPEDLASTAAIADSLIDQFVTDWQALPAPPALPVKVMIDPVHLTPDQLKLATKPVQVANPSPVVNPVNPPGTKPDGIK